MRVFNKRPHANLVQSYGPELVKAFRQATLGEWNAVPTHGGWRVLRLDSITPAKSAVYETLREVVRKDWKDAALSEQRDAAVRALVKSYKVIYMPPVHHHH